MFPLHNSSLKSALPILKKTSRTFYIPISRLDPGLKEAVTSAYLCMRAIDEIEDHDDLSEQLKINLLHQLHQAFQSNNVVDNIKQILSPYEAQLPEVTNRLDEWVLLCPSSITETVFHYISLMAEDMANWVQNNWEVRTEEDLDRYTYSVAGLVGLMLSEIWKWHDGTDSNSLKAIAFGRGLQAVNILRNKDDDLRRGVNFYPDGWGLEEMLHYAQRNLQLADSYVADLKQGPSLEFCKIPLALAHATVNVISSGGSKLTRLNVLKIINNL